MENKIHIEENYYRNGSLKEKYEFFVNDETKLVFHGDYKEYYSNGNLKKQGTFKKGYKSGEWIFYYENGIVESRRIFDSNNYGYSEGKQIFYYDNGNVFKIENYNRGVFQSIKKYENGEYEENILNVLKNRAENISDDKMFFISEGEIIPKREYLKRSSNER